MIQCEKVVFKDETTQDINTLFACSPAVSWSAAPRSPRRSIAAVRCRDGLSGVVCGVWCVVCGVWCVVCGVWRVDLPRNAMGS